MWFLVSVSVLREYEVEDDKCPGIIDPTWSCPPARALREPLALPVDVKLDKVSPHRV